MDEQSKVNALINVGQMKIAEKAYDDILSDPGKKIGAALGTILNVGNTLLWPIKWANERTRIFFESNIRKYEEEVSKIPQDKITEVPTEISMPILERFTYTSNEELSNAFINLLTKASSEETINEAHPGFIQIIDRLSPDEAKILKYLSSINAIAYMDIKHHNNDEFPDQYKYVLKDTNLLLNKIQLNFPTNVSFYLDNLSALGLLQKRDYYYIYLDDDFNQIESIYRDYLDSIFSLYDDNELLNRKVILKGMYEKTSYGDLFIKACINS